MGMSKAEEEEQARLERARAVGLFRYMLIREAADPALSSRQRGAMVRAIAAREHGGPSGEPVRVTRWTLDVWIRAWRHGGFDALVPSPRQSQPRTPPEVMALAVALKKENPARTAAQGGAGRFSSSRKAVRFAGLDITVWSSDRKGPPGRLSRQGPEVLRWTVYEAGKTHARASAPDHRYYAAVKDRQGGKRAALSEARKILRQACHILAELGDDALSAA